MSELKIGVQLASFRQPLKQALLTANRLGAAGVEIDARREVLPAELTQTGLRQIRKWLDDLQLQVCAVRFQTRRGYNVAEDLEPRIAGTKAAMKLAHGLGCHVVVNHIGRVPEKPEGPEWNLLLEALTDIGNLGQHYGAILAAETGDDPKHLARLLEQLPRGSAGADLNPGNLVAAGHSPLEAAHSLGDFIVHVHANDAVRETARGRGIEVELGRGLVDFTALLGALEEHDYRGYLTIQRQEARDPLHEIGQSVQYLRALIRGG